MSMMRRVVFGSAVCLVLAPSVSGSTPPFTLGGDPRVDPANFRVTTFAEGLAMPVGMTELSDGSILYGASIDHGGGTPFYGGSRSTFQLRRLVDSDGDGVADNGTGDLLFSGTDGDGWGGVNAIVQAGELVIVDSLNFESEVGYLHVLRKGANPGDALTHVGQLTLNYPTDPLHMNHGLAVRQTDERAYEVFFNIGAHGDRVNSSPGGISASGLTSGTLDADSIYSVALDDLASTGAPSLSNLTRIASGLRNVAGMAFHPDTGDLYFSDNGINNTQSAEELNRLAADDIGGDVEFYGFATDYIAYPSGERVVDGAEGIQPLAAFLPLDGAKSEGPNQLVFTPAGFPGLGNGILLGFHGVYAAGGTDNDENPVVFYDLATGDYFHLIGPGIEGVGHLVGLLDTADSIFLADMTPTGSFFRPPGRHNGVIYQIQAIPEPTSLSLLAALGTLALLRRHGRCRGTG